ncbi:MAG TPA: squalene--hopene cyclase [Candidatus Dormibacteraeota bacterium]|jgi:squalene-hopene/tetraprenyl-beta-curcumene cyclase|nr:squalene--hopene cyclase [Candidatus Dormibacteraeota bacterium]
MKVMTEDALGRAVHWLLERQDAEGWWTGELETNVTMTAEHVLLCRFLDLDLNPIRQGAIEHILRGQREDGSWALYHEGPADLSTTIEAYAALRVLGLDASAEPLARALRLIHRLGGVARARIFTKIWLALFGEYPWEGVPSMPPELIWLPKWAPLNLYNFACWARGTIAPLLLVLTRRPVRDLGVSLPELVVEGTEPLLHRVPGSGPFWWLDQLLKLYDRLPLHPGRPRARRAVSRWIVERQEADGGWGGIQPPWVYSLIGLHLEGMGTDHEVMRKGIAGFEGFALNDREGWRFQACMSPVWDTAWVIRALALAGRTTADDAVRRAVDWTLKEQVNEVGVGDWQVRCPGVTEGGGWAFEFENDVYPDIDDTAVVVCGLLEAGPHPGTEEACARAVRWVREMRSRNGAWAAFDRDNTDQLAYRLPFADFGALLDPPTEDVTAHVLEMFAAVRAPLDDPMVQGGLDYLRREQRPDGSWFGRWGVNYIYGTWCCVSGLTALGVGHDMVDRACDWLVSRQNPDGGWGETCHSYEDPSFAGVGVSTASQTAWALISLMLSGRRGHDACARGLYFLRERQEDGTWDEPEFTGTGFPRDFYLNYHLYRHVFPTMALAMADGIEEV